MSNGLIGAVLGIILGIVWVFQGFWSAVLVAALGVAGWLIGRFIKIDLGALRQKIGQFLTRQS
ncbi:DUF2273 domain-containing protein [Lentilactobacillus senioris]|uniref:Small integral membrane protein n=1 Tax=Lentilactobacillus senioris DSM 24302 = JCM 17472 TaxID=1423802 RepID=A0A0R2CQB9_9LACO|nr:DUF2273 domain-containing protein [Lentilactobacillus senioris]KRM93981.1 hypothetical protein FC56_GL000702 [Lentilactobacillus senioris DSM 24302 = JCM 17472]MCY9806991.1 DUF2273 domain-containing protein [Lentilactobacillus senioris]